MIFHNLLCLSRSKQVSKWQAFFAQWECWFSIWLCFRTCYVEKSGAGQGVVWLLAILCSVTLCLSFQDICAPDMYSCKIHMLRIQQAPCPFSCVLLAYCKCPETSSYQLCDHGKLPSVPHLEKFSGQDLWLSQFLINLVPFLQPEVCLAFPSSWDLQETLWSISHCKMLLKVLLWQRIFPWQWKDNGSSS